MARVFISYRREETSGHAGRLHDKLTARLGADEVFMDLTLEPGEDFVEHLREAVEDCSVLVVLIGPEWAGIQDEDGRVRLDDPNDFVRLEIEIALNRRDLRLIPALVRGAKMPRPGRLPESLEPLLHRQALELSDSRWSHDTERLIQAIERVTGPTRKRATVPRKRERHGAQKRPPAEKRLVSDQVLKRVLSDAVERGRLTSADAREIHASARRRAGFPSREGPLDAIREHQLPVLVELLRAAADKGRLTSADVSFLAQQLDDKSLVEARRERGRSFPIADYDDLRASEILDLLTDLTRAQLLRVVNYEARTFGRKTIMNRVYQLLD
jgi:TIR domain-containing protein